MSEAGHIVGLSERHAFVWAGDRSRMGQFFEKAWLDRFIALIPAGATILDPGSGFGKPMAACLIAQGLNVCGIDSSPTVISLCRKEFPDCQWIVADMRILNLGRSFSGIVAWNSFFHLSFDDQRRMFPVFAAHATSNAPLLFTSGPKHGEAIGQSRGEPLYHANLEPAEYRALLATCGFSVVDARMDDTDCGRHPVWLARRIEAR